MSRVKKPSVEGSLLKGEKDYFFLGIAFLVFTKSTHF